MRGNTTAVRARRSLALGAVTALAIGVLAGAPAPAGTAPHPDRPAATMAGEAELPLPALPLPDCVANGLTVDNATDCEGTVPGYAPTTTLPPVPTPGTLELTANTRALDFRKDADRPGAAQTVTFTWANPGQLTAVGPDGRTYRSSFRYLWPDFLDGGSWNNHYSMRRGDSPFWEPEQDGAPYGASANPPATLFVRQGDCGGVGTQFQTVSSCTYKVAWGQYDKRVREELIYRVGLRWSLSYNVQKTDGTYECGADPSAGCALPGQNWSYTTFRTVPPPPLTAVADVKRLGAREFEFDASRSGPDAAAYQWDNLSPVFASTAKTFTVDLDDYTLPPFFVGALTNLRVTDKWNRPKYTSVQWSLLVQQGTEGPLKIKTYTLVGIENGVARLKATVENTTASAITRVGLVGSRVPAGAVVGTSPATVDIPAKGTIDFDITVPIGSLSSIVVNLQAFGTGSGGPVKSAPAVQTVPNVDVPQPTCTPGKPVVSAVTTTTATVTVPPGTCPAAAAANSADTEGLPTGWRLFTYQGGASTASKSQDLAKAATSTVVTGLTAGTTYRFKLAATNASGAGPASAYSSFTAPPFSTFDTFTNRQHLDFRLRNATAAEKASWNSKLSAGTLTPADAVDDAVDFPEWAPVQSPVTRLFQAYFLRLPDLGGLDYWSDKSRHGTTLSTISGSFARSKEFSTRYGSLSNKAFVGLVYLNVLGRPGEAAGIAYWTTALDTGAKSRGAVMIGFSESKEYRAKTAPVTNLVNVYTGMLRRLPTSAEAATWRPLLEGGAPRTNLIKALLSTAAYDARVS